MLKNLLKDNIDLFIGDMQNKIILFKLGLNELKSKNKKKIFNILFNDKFELDNDEKISIDNSLNEIIQNSEKMKEMLSKSSQLITASVINTVRTLEKDVYKSLSNIVDRIENSETRNNVYSIIYSSEHDTDRIVFLKNNLLVSNYLDYRKLNKQNILLQIFVGGILQINDSADKGDYLLTEDDDKNLIAVFHDIIPANTSICVFAIKTV